MNNPIKFDLLFIVPGSSLHTHCANNSKFQPQKIWNLEIESSKTFIGEDFFRLKWIKPPMCEDFEFTLQFFDDINSMTVHNISISYYESIFNATDTLIYEGDSSFLKLIGTKEGTLCNMGRFYYYTFEGNNYSDHV